MLWPVFRRVVLGCFVEVLVSEAVAVDLPSIEIAFDPDSEFRVPRIDNFMRFKGSFSATLAEQPAPEVLARVVSRLRGVWQELVGVVELPVGDRLTVHASDIRATAEARPDGRALLRVTFDLSAD